MRTIKAAIAAAVTVSIMLSAWLMLRLTIPYLSFDYEIDFLLTKQAILHVDIWRWAFYLHITTSLFVLAFGLVQFIKPVMRKYPCAHRVMGKIYVLLVLVFSAPTGLVMGFYANGGWPAKISFILVSLLWWYFTWKAYAEIRKGNYEKHISFMIRSYALTLSAITLRTYVIVFPSFFILPAREMYTLVSWLSWVPNLIIAEALIKRRTFNLK